MTVEYNKYKLYYNTNLLLSRVRSECRVEQVLTLLTSVGTEGIVVAVLHLGVSQNHHLQLRSVENARGLLGQISYLIVDLLRDDLVPLLLLVAAQWSDS